jgi:hypothetical protein
MSASTGNANSSPLATKVVRKDTATAAKAENAAAKAENAAAQEAAQAEKDGRAARPGSRAHTRFLQEYYRPEVVKAREEEAAARCRAGNFGQASK